MLKRSTAFLLILVFTQSALAQAPAKGKDVFQKVGLLVNVGDKAKETPVSLQFDDGKLLIISRKGGSELKTFAYSDIVSGEYSHSKHPRWRAGLGAAIAVGIFALPLFFMKGKKHWLTVRTQNDFAVLRLDKDNYKIILPTFEARTGKKVETLAEDK